MIVLTANKTIKPGCRDAFVKVMEELTKESRKEEGCISYRVCESINDPSDVLILEEWKDNDALEYHNNTEHFKRLVPLMSEYTCSSRDVTLYREI